VSERQQLWGSVKFVPSHLIFYQWQKTSLTSFSFSAELEFMGNANSEIQLSKDDEPDSSAADGTSTTRPKS
jgi:hypothetical protein